MNNSTSGVKNTMQRLSGFMVRNRGPLAIYLLGAIMAWLQLRSMR